MRITRSAVVVATVISSALLLIAGTQPWLVLGLSSDESSANELVVTGATLAPSFVGLTLAYAAALIVALVSRFVVRIASAAIAMAAALGALIVSLLVISDPVPAARVSIATVTGVSDSFRQRDLIDTLALTPWAFIALVLLVGAACVGVAVIVLGRSWSNNSRRYERPEPSPIRQGTRDGVTESDPHETWDNFSGGGDPTRTPGH
jgi:uncharacterized membrane protein (TIGR02234 family)